MKILVCIKQVPDMESKFKIAPTACGMTGPISPGG